MPNINFNNNRLVTPLSRDPSEDAPSGWLETLRNSDDDIAAGRVVPVDDVLKELDEVIASMDASHAPKP